MSDKQIEIYTDGGARGNPGPAASAFVALMDDKKIKEGSRYLGETTNNVAEYNAVIMAMKWLCDQEKKDLNVTFFIDSQLVVRQIKGEYKVKNSRLKNLYTLLMQKINECELSLKFVHVKREKNKWADSLVNKELDENMR